MFKKLLVTYLLKCSKRPESNFVSLTSLGKRSHTHRRSPSLLLNNRKGPDPKFRHCPRKMITKAGEMNLPLGSAEDEVFEDAREEPEAEWQETEKPWASKASSPGSFRKTAVLIVLALLVI